ncbi:MAG: methionyl-tRNA formyltransferase [Malacoplasma sp.]
MEKERRDQKSKKIVFMGTPLIATYALKGLIDLGHQIICVVTQTDKVSGRKKEIIFSETKTFALQNNLHVIQTESMIDLYKILKDMDFDYIFTCAYGKFISDDVLELPKIKAVNMHASLLPKYRGGAPIHWAIINQEKVTGISLIKMEKKMDAGEIYFQDSIQIDLDDTTSSLTLKMGELIYRSIIKNFDYFIDNKFQPIIQNENDVTFALNIKREQEKINWEQSSDAIHAFVRGLFDKPFAFTLINNIEIKIIATEISDIKSSLLPGTISNITSDGIFVSTKTNDIKIVMLKIAGKAAVSVKDFINGNRIFSINSKFS